MNPSFCSTMSVALLPYLIIVLRITQG
jgi:hypothetical protein